VPALPGGSGVPVGFSGQTPTMIRI
jgi:hypothetical protein